MDADSRVRHSNQQENNARVPSTENALVPQISNRSLSAQGPQGEDDAASSQTVRPALQGNLQARATTAVSLTDIGSKSHEEVPKQDSVAGAIRSLPGTLKAKASLSQLASSRGSEAGDSASVRSSIPNTEAGEAENLFGDLASESGSNAQDATGLLQFPEFKSNEFRDDFTSEFEPVGEVDESRGNEG